MNMKKKTRNYYYAATSPSGNRNNEKLQIIIIKNIYKEERKARKEHSTSDCSIKGWIVGCRQAQKVLVVASVRLTSKTTSYTPRERKMKLLLVMLLVSGLLIGESRAQGPFVRFFNNIFTNFRNRLGLGVKSTTSTALLSTVTVTTTITEAIGLSPDVGFVPSIIQEPEIITEMASTDSNTFTTMTEETTDVASTDNPLIINKVELPIESSTPAENDQVALEIGTEGPELDHSDASVIEALAQVMLEVPTTTPESLTTPQNVVSETEAIVIKNVPPVLNSTTFSTLAPKRTIHFTRPSWTPTFLKLANRASTSRYFFPATFRRPKVDDSAISEIELHTENFVLSPSKPLSVENSLAPRIPYVVKRHVDIESSMTALNQQQSSVLSVRAATD